MSKNDIMPDEWHIKFTPRAEYAAQEDVRALNKFAKGVISEEECLSTIEYNNGFNKNSLTHDQLIATMIWLGFYHVYKDHHTIDMQDLIIEHYFHDKRAELVEKCRLAR